MSLENKLTRHITLLLTAYCLVWLYGLNVVSAARAPGGGSASSGNEERKELVAPEELPPPPLPPPISFPAPSSLKRSAEQDQTELRQLMADKNYLAKRLKTMDKERGAFDMAKSLVLAHAKRSQIEQFCALCPHCHSRTAVVPIFGFMPYSQEDYDFGFVNTSCTPSSQKWYCRNCKGSFFPYQVGQLILDGKVLNHKKQ